MEHRWADATNEGIADAECCVGLCVFTRSGRSNAAQILGPMEQVWTGLRDGHRRVMTIVDPWLRYGLFKTRRVYVP